MSVLKLASHNDGEFRRAFFVSSELLFWAGLSGAATFLALVGWIFA